MRPEPLDEVPVGAERLSSSTSRRFPVVVDSPLNAQRLLIEVPVIRLAASATLNLIANAIAILLAAIVLSGVGLGFTGFVVAVLVYTLVSALVEPLIRQIAVKNMPAILGSTALVATLVSLIVTVIVTDSLTISGLVTWILAAVIVWLGALVARLLLPLVLFKQILAEARN